MRCSTAKRYADIMLDAELNPAKRQALQQHLAKCPTCRKWQYEAQTMQLMLSAELKADVPAWVHAQILDKVHRLDNNHPSFVRRFKLATASAALAVFISLWAGAQIGIKSFNPTNTASESNYASASYTGFGENSILDSFYSQENGNE